MITIPWVVPPSPKLLPTKQVMIVMLLVVTIAGGAGTIQPSLSNAKHKLIPQQGLLYVSFWVSFFPTSHIAA